MDQKLRIAFLQISPCDSLDENVLKGISACRKAHDGLADIAIFPEMWSDGYSIADKSGQQLCDEAIGADDPAVIAFQNLAEELGIAIVFTFLEKHPGAPLNSLVLFDRHGDLKMKYSKVHTCDFGYESVLARGNGFHVAVLDTKAGPVSVGAMICFDREFPESARILMLEGAELILVPNACPMEINRLSQLRTRAFENMAAIATCNYPVGTGDCNGHSSLFDGIAWTDESSSRDCCVFLAEEDEGIFFADIDLGLPREYRKNEVFGNAYRRPGLYGILSDGTVRDPFIRDDARR